MKVMKSTSFGKVSFESVMVAGSYVVTNDKPVARFKETSYEWLECFIINNKHYTVKKFVCRTANRRKPCGVSISKGFKFEGEIFPENYKAVIDRIIQKYGV